MKIRKNMVIRFISATTIVCAAISMAVFPSYAVNVGNINSKGNIVLEDGEVALYASDIDYLQNEIDNLFDEIPDEDKILTDSIDNVRKENIQSKGIIDYSSGEVVINSLDLIYLANEIDVLEHTYKKIILKYLNGINTYMTSDGSITHDVVNSDVAYYPKFEDLINGISLSQEVETETTAANLSNDKAAWVNGNLIIGTGVDNQSYYDKGYAQGYKDAQEGVDVEYTYHTHKDASGSIRDDSYQSSVSGGCFTKPAEALTYETCYHLCGHSEPSYEGSTGNFQNVYRSYFGAGSMSQCTKGSYMDWTAENYEGRFQTHQIATGTSFLGYYTVGCGKSESSIESATITFQ